VDLADEALNRNQLAGAKLIRLLEDGDPRGTRGLKKLYPHSGRAHVVGITGPPGAGKSTLVAAVVRQIRKTDRRVAVIAVDPSSPFSGGAILGDRVRMQEHATDEGVFIRSMATRGMLGGLSRSSFETTLVLDAMGYDVIIVETVGVGQDELEIAQLAHTTLVVSVPGLGDGIQAMKAGILEIGELHVINKADLPGADALEKQLHVMLESRDREEGAWHPQIYRTIADRGEGVEPLVHDIFAHRDHLERKGRFAEIERERGYHFFLELLREGACEKILDAVDQSAETRGVIEDLHARRIDPISAAESLVAKFRCEGLA